MDGRRAEGSIEVSDDDQEQVVIELVALPNPGMHLLQVQAENGQFSNDFIFHVTKDAKAAAELQRSIDEPHVLPSNALAKAVARGDLEDVKKRLGVAARINARQGEGGSTLLSTAALYGHLDIARFLLERGADISAANDDGNTPLHVAAFLCRTEIVKLLLDRGGSVAQKNRRGETPIDVISGAWSEGLTGFYKSVADAVGIELDLHRIQRERPKVAKLLLEYADKSP